MKALPTGKGRSAEEIISENIYFDSHGFLYRAVSWLDYVERTKQFSALYYACADARLGIEHLMYELLVICNYADFSEEHYQRCVRDPGKLDKLFQKMNPDYIKIQEFTSIVNSLTLGMPRTVSWHLPELRKSWGHLSKYLHWYGIADRTINTVVWQNSAMAEVTSIISPIWDKLGQGRIGALDFKSMPEPVQSIFNEFKADKINAKEAKCRLYIAKSLLSAQLGGDWFGPFSS